MEQIMIIKPDGSVVPMVSKRTVTAIKSAKQTWELLGNDVVNINVESPFPQVYGIGDKIIVFGRVYKLNRLPKVRKTGMHAFSYDLEFEGVQYDLLRATYDLTIDTTNNELQDVQADSLTGDLKRFATVLIANANRIFPGVLTLGTCPDTDTLTLTFGESDNCLSVLQNICSEFEVEFEIVQSSGLFTINFVEKVGQVFPTTFQFGKGKGLYSLDRQNVDSSNIVTRLKVYGSTSNITHKYRAARLCLPGKSKGQSYIEKPEAIAKYGIYEATKYFDDIKPTFNGVVTGIVPVNVLQFSDTNMFDLNESDENGTKYLLNGVSTKIHFNTGNLAGYEFDVHAYDHATHTFTLVKITDERSDEFPSSISPAFQFSVGDEYKILDVALPPEYETDAENKLLEAGNTYYDQNSQPKVQYALSVTKDYLKKYVGNGTTVNIFAPGDYIPIKDDDIDVDKSVRIKSLTRNLLDEYEYELTISDTVSTNITNRVISELIDIDKIITINNLKDPARARNNWRNSQELLNMVFDPDGDYYTEKIKPESIDTVALSVGAKSMQFGLTNTVFQPNYQGNKNVIEVTGGVLTHYTIDENAARSWTLADNTTTFDDDSTAYYIYAKCERSGIGGSIIFSTSQIKVDQDVNYYHFWIGVVNSVNAELNARSISLSYGFSTINGRFIKTGRIESSGGSGSFFDLDNNEFKIGDSNTGLSWNENENGKLILKGTMVQSGSGVVQPVGVFRGAYNSTYTYYQGDEATYTLDGITSSYRYINQTPTVGNAPTNATYWQVIAQGVKGKDGDDGVPGAQGAPGTPGAPGADADYYEFRYAVNGSTSTAPSLTATDANPSGWNTSQPSVGSLQYLWQTSAKKNASGVLVNNWSNPVRVTPYDGKDGDTGPSCVFRGDYISSDTYYGTPKRVDVVKYNGIFYVTRSDAGNGFNGKVPTDTNYWNGFGAQFDSVATDFLVAANGTFGKAVFNGDYMFSQTGRRGSDKYSTDFQYFNPDSPDDYTNYFAPNYYINLKTGRFKSNTGVIGPFQHTESGIYTETDIASDGISLMLKQILVYGSRGQVSLSGADSVTENNVAILQVSSNTTPAASVSNNSGKAMLVSSGTQSNPGKAIDGLGGIVSDGPVAGYRSYIAVSGSTSNPSGLSYQNKVICIQPTVAGGRFALPTLSEMLSKLGSTANLGFQVKIEIVNITGPVGTYNNAILYGRNSAIAGMSTSQYPQLYGHNNNTFDNYTIGGCDSVSLFLIYTGSSYFAIEETYNT